MPLLPTAVRAFMAKLGRLISSQTVQSKVKVKRTYSTNNEIRLVFEIETDPSSLRKVVQQELGRDKNFNGNVSAVLVTKDQIIIKLTPESRKTNDTKTDQRTPDVQGI